MHERRIIIASNRGPISFVRNENGEVEATRGAGGLVTALTAALQRLGGLWIASAMSDEDREQTAHGKVEVMAEDARYNLRYLSFDPETYDRYYNEISNQMLWYVHHALWSLPREPRWTAATVDAWRSYDQVNRAFADALMEEGASVDGDPAYLVQDYHLTLVPRMIREQRPDARIAHFSHIPFTGLNYFRVLPSGVRDTLLQGLLGADVVGFHAERWAENFLLACRTLPGAAVELRNRRVQWEGREVKVGIYPITIDDAALRRDAKLRSARRAVSRLERWRGDRKLILRVDRTDLSKNMLRGFEAYDAFLDAHPEWREKVVFLALANPSRTDVADYRTYTRDCRRAVSRINERWGTPGWRPAEIRVQDDLSTAMAGYELYDALMVNPVFDGMNLVAKEGPTLNRRDGVLILSENAGAYAELGRFAVGVNPFDVDETAGAIHRALEMDGDERARLADGLRAAVARTTLEDWVKAQLDDLDGDPEDG